MSHQIDFRLSQISHLFCWVVIDSVKSPVGWMLCLAHTDQDTLQGRATCFSQGSCDGCRVNMNTMGAKGELVAADLRPLQPQTQPSTSPLSRQLGKEKGINMTILLTTNNKGGASFSSGWNPSCPHQTAFLCNICTSSDWMDGNWSTWYVWEEAEGNGKACV